MKILKVFLLGAPLALTMACGSDIDQQAQGDRQVQEQQQQRDQHTDRSTGSRMEQDQGRASGRLSNAMPIDRSSNAVTAGRSGNAVAINQLIGSSVRTHDSNEEIGQLADILADSTGSPLAAIISTSEFLGLGGKDVAVDWENITVVSENDHRAASSRSDGARADSQRDQRGTYGNRSETTDQFQDSDGYVVLVNMTEEDLNDAPEYERPRD